MAWVRSEYAGEFAVLSTWLAALIPWSVTVLSDTYDAQQFTIVQLRWVFFRIRYLFGLSFGDQTSRQDFFALVHEVPGYNVPELTIAGYGWLLAALVLFVAVVLSIVYYAREEGFEESLPVDPVRLVGVLLLATAVILTLSLLPYLYYQSVTIPVGVLFQYLFAYLLLTVDRV